MEMNRMHNMLAVLFVMMALLVAGCASNGQIGEDTKRLALQYATIKAIAGSDGIDPAEVIDAAERFKSGLTGEVEVPVNSLEAAAMEWAKEKGLDPADQLLVMHVVEQVVLNLTTDDDQQFLDEDDRVRLIELLDVIIEAARIAG